MSLVKPPNSPPTGFKVTSLSHVQHWVYDYERVPDFDWREDIRLLTRDCLDSIRWVNDSGGPYVKHCDKRKVPVSPDDAMFPLEEPDCVSFEEKWFIIGTNIEVKPKYKTAMVKRPTKLDIHGTFTCKENWQDLTACTHGFDVKLDNTLLMTGIMIESFSSDGENLVGSFIAETVGKAV